MKKMLSENLLLKIVALAAAVVLWITVLNIDNPTETFIVSNIPITVLNADSALTANGLTYELQSDPVASVEVTARRTDKKKINADNFSASIDMNEIYAATGSVAVTVSLDSNKSLVRSWTQITRSVVVSVEQIVTKNFDIQVVQRGNAADSITFQNADIFPKTVMVRGPESIVKQVGDARVYVDVSDRADDFEDDYEIEFYDVYGDPMPLEDDENVRLSAKTAKIRSYATKTNQIYIDVAVVGGENVAPGYKYITYQSEVQTVEVTGAKTLVAEFEKIQIKEDITGVDGEFTKEYELKDYLPAGLELAPGQPETISITYQIEAIRNRTIVIPEDQVQLQGTDEGFSYHIGGEGYVPVVLQGLEEDLNKVKESDILVNLDVSGFKAAGIYYATPTVSLSETYGSFFEVSTDRIRVELREKSEETEPVPPYEESSEDPNQQD